MYVDFLANYRVERGKFSIIIFEYQLNFTDE